MKKILAVLLVAVLTLSIVACGGNEASDTDKSDPATSETVGGESESNESDDGESQPNDESVPEDESDPEDESVPEDESQPADESNDESTPEDTETIPAFASNFVTWASLGVGLRATDSTSIQLTGVNKEAGYGDVVIYTYDYDQDKVTVKDGKYADYAYLVAEYDSSLFGVKKTAVYNAGTLSDNASLTIPEVGFIIAAHKDQTVMSARLSECPDDVTLFAAGVQVCDVNYSITKVNSAISIDGNIEDAWKQHKIDSINESNNKWAYWSFVENEYYSTAEYYVTYDNDNLYLAVVVDSPYHYCPISPSDPGGMYQYECIQVKVTTVSPKSEYIMENYDHVINNAANTDGYVRAYGFAVNDDGETCYYENSGVSKTFQGKAVCTRNDDAQLTVYEVSIPWSSLDLNADELDKFGLTFSINSTNEEDVEKGTWRNLVLFDGGGVIKRNDWAKIPEVTIVH